MTAAPSDDDAEAPKRRTAVSRELTPERLERLLSALDPDRETAAERYVSIRARLAQYFVWERCTDAGALADDVVDRVARRLAEGEQIPNLPGYFLGVARLVRLEARQRQQREERVGAEAARALHHGDDPDDTGPLDCLARCLSRLSPDRRRDLMTYYTGGAGARIENRRRLADERGIGSVALRNRMLRLRQRLETCVSECLAARGVRDGSGTIGTPVEARSGTAPTDDAS
ncbi:MAG: hypothetical protein U0Q12_19390 [Vicinamibacterales bacterium]